MVEIKKEKQIYHCLNTVYKNHLSTHCTFIYLPLKILKLLHWEQTTNRASRNIKNTQPSESELGVNFPFFFFSCFGALITGHLMEDGCLIGGHLMEVQLYTEWVKGLRGNPDDGQSVLSLKKSPAIWKIILRQHGLIKQRHTV